MCNVGPRAHRLFFCRKISYTRYKYICSLWACIAQANYLCNVGPLSTNTFAQKNNLQFCLDLPGPILHKEGKRSAQVYFHRKNGFCLVACFLTGCIITKQSWLFLFNDGSGVRLRLVGRQWTGADINWNISKDQLKD